MQLKYARDILGRIDCIREVVENFFTEQLGEYRPSGMTFSQLMLIYRLSKTGPVSAKRLRESCYSGTNVNHNLATMVKKGMIKRARSRVDRRGVVCSLSQKGEELAARLAVVVNKVEEHVGETVTVGKTGALIGWFESQPHNLLAESIANAVAKKEPKVSA